MRRVLFLTFELPPELAGGIASVAVDKISGFRTSGLRVHVVGPSAMFVVRRKEFAAPFLPIPVYGNIIKFAVQFLWSFWLCVFHRPDIIYSMSGTYSGMVARILGLLFRLPYFVMAHGNEFIRFEHSRASRFIRNVYMHAAGVMAVSDFTAREVSRIYGVGPRTVHTVYNGVRADRFAPAPEAEVAALRTRLALPSTARVLATVGRIDERKGHEMVLRALAQLSDRGITSGQIRYVIAGRGPYADHLADAVKALGLAEYVTLLGFVPSHQLPAIYSLADLFVMPSRHLRGQGSVEGFGLVYVEAGLCGTASLGGRSGGVADAIVEQETGHLVDGESPEPVANIVADLIDRPDHYLAMGRRAREIYLERFTLERVLGREMKIMNEALERQP